MHDLYLQVLVYSEFCDAATAEMLTLHELEGAVLLDPEVAQRRLLSEGCVVLLSAQTHVEAREMLKRFVTVCTDVGTKSGLAQMIQDELASIELVIVAEIPWSVLSPADAAACVFRRA